MHGARLSLVVARNQVQALAGARNWLLSTAAPSISHHTLLMCLGRLLPLGVGIMTPCHHRADPAVQVYSSQAHQSTVQQTSSTCRAVTSATSHMTLAPTPTLPISPTGLTTVSTSSALPRMELRSRSPSPRLEGVLMLPTQQRTTRSPAKRSSLTALEPLVPSEQSSTSAHFVRQSSTSAPPASPEPKRLCQDSSRVQASSEQPPSPGLSEEVSCYYE